MQLSASNRGNDHTQRQLFTSNVQTGFPNGSVVPVATATVTPNSLTGTTLGSVPLTPEKSLSFSGGFVVTPGGGFTATVDYYNVRVKDRISIRSSIDVTAAQQAQLFALGVANAFDLGQVNSFTNGFTTRTQGVDAVLSHRASTSSGIFSTSLAVNYNQTKVLEVTAAGAIDAQRINNIRGLTPKWRGVLAETWSMGNFDATGRLNYYGSITSYNSANLAPATIQSFGADWSFDLEIGVTVAENFCIAAGGENLFNRYPDRNLRNTYAQTGGALVSGRLYNDASPLSYMGGFWYVRGQVNFQAAACNAILLRLRAAGLSCRPHPYSSSTEGNDMKAMMTAMLLGASMLAMPAGAAEINRIGNTPQANILTGVIVPPGAEMFYLSGQLASPIDATKPPTGPESYGDTKTQTISTFNRIKAALAAQGYAMSDVIKLTVFVAAAPGMDGKMDFKGFNEGYREFFGTAENPNKIARSTVQVAALAGPNFLVEIEATAAKLPK